MSLLFALSPLLALALGGLLLMLTEAFGKPTHASASNSEGVVIDAGAGRGAELGILSALILLFSTTCSFALWLTDPAVLAVQDLAPYLIIDRFSVFFFMVLSAMGFLVCLFGGAYLPEHRIERGEFFSLVVFSTAGAMILCAAGDLLSIFLALETMSLGVYAMVGLRRGSRRSSEAALKYFLLGSFAAAVLLFASALLYGATGSTDLRQIGRLITALDGEALQASAGLILVAMGLILGSLAFKMSAVPFHMWAPDTYEGAPTPTSSYMASIVKISAFALLLRFLSLAFVDERLSSWGSGWPPVIVLLSTLTMFVANFISSQQSSVKRMLAYSSITHAGYALVGVAAMSRNIDAQSSVLFYMATYGLATVGAFGSLMLAGSFGKEAVSYEDLAGLGRRHPTLALGFTIFLMSLAGLPPTVGFLGKMYVFRAAIDSEMYWLAVIGFVNSVVSAYYYLKVIVFMYMREPKENAPFAIPMKSPLAIFALLLAALLVLSVGVFPEALLNAANAAVMK